MFQPSFMFVCLPPNRKDCSILICNSSQIFIWRNNAFIILFLHKTRISLRLIQLWWWKFQRLNLISILLQVSIDMVYRLCKRVNEIYGYVNTYINPKNLNTKTGTCPMTLREKNANAESLKLHIDFLFASSNCTIGDNPKLVLLPAMFLFWCLRWSMLPSFVQHSTHSSLALRGTAPVHSPFRHVRWQDQIELLACRS